MAVKSRTLKWGGLGILALGVGVVAKRFHARRKSSARDVDKLAEKLQTMKKARTQLEEAVQKLDRECEQLQAEIKTLKDGEAPGSDRESQGDIPDQEE